MTTTFGGLTLKFSSIGVSQQPHRKKQTLGKRVTQHSIIGSDTNDYVLTVKGYFHETTPALLQAARDALEALNNGKGHAYAESLDDTYDGNYVIETGSLTWETNINMTYVTYSMRLVQW